MKQRVLCVINPASGQDYPILATLNRGFTQINLDWEPLVTKPHKPVAHQLKTFDLTQYTFVCVYGGDGTVNQVAQLLLDRETPIFPLQGGTGNTLAKELKIPADVAEAMAKLATKKYTIQAIDTAEANNHFFVNAAIIGPLGQINTETSRELKDSLGVLAYAHTFITKIPLSQEIDFQLELDNRTIKTRGAALLILNSRFSSLGKFKISANASLTNGSLVLATIPRIDQGFDI